MSTGDVFVSTRTYNSSYNTITKYNSDGVFQWDHSYSSTNTSDSLITNQIAVDSGTGSVTVVGSFGGTGKATFDASPTPAPTKGKPKPTSDTYGFALKLNANGAQESLQKTVGVSPSDIAIDKDGSTYITGSMISTVDFDPGIG